VQERERQLAAVRAATHTSVESREAALQEAAAEHETARAKLAQTVRALAERDAALSDAEHRAEVNHKLTALCNTVNSI
jgi:hypothetical protein